MKGLIVEVGRVARTFADEETGATFVEYLVVLGIITAAVVTAVVAFGGAIAAAFVGWTSWVGGNVGSP
jgi:pilus assembly protein Flp/PilA